MAEIKKESLVDLTYKQLREEIITLQRPLGSRLNVNELQVELGVSCTPIREAINRLQQEGLVVYQNNIGAHVLDLTKHDVLEIQQVALTLHTTAATLAMEAGDQATLLEALETRLKLYKEATTAHEEVTAVFRLMGSFYHCCGNKRLANSMIAIIGQQLLLRNMYIGSHSVRGEDLADYEELVECVRRGDRDGAVNVLMKNGEKMTAQLLTLVDE